jgi:AcrR family transcriptional regulator
VPKRDVAYMQGQRDQIAQAALECLIEKGVPETSLRDVCKRAGVSIGALYVHFPTKDDLILAACALDIDDYEFKPIPETWEEFESAIVKMFKYLRTPRQMRRMRLAFQFVADLTVANESPSGVSENYQLRVASLQAVLRRLHDKGEIALPLGLEATAAALFNFFIGTNYVSVVDRTTHSPAAIESMLAAMALIVGRGSTRKQGR